MELSDKKEKILKVIILSTYKGRRVPAFFILSSVIHTTYREIKQKKGETNFICISQINLR